MDSYIKIFKYYIRISLLNCLNYSIDIFSILINYRTVKRYAINIDRERTIGLIADKFMSRIDKIAYGLVSNGYTIILICKDQEHFDKTISTIFTCRSNFKALWLAKQFNVSMYHTFSNWNYDISYYLIKHKRQLHSSIVFDDYDVMAGMVYEEYANTRYPGHLKKEKYCLEHADGLCCRSLETQYAKRELGYQYKGKRIFFPEYPWKTQPPNSTNIHKKEKTIIYVGGFNSMIRPIAVQLHKIGWSLDIYPAHVIKNKYDFPDNIHIFRSINPRELAQALQPYKIAIQFPGNIISDNLPRYTPYKFYYSAAGKIFDYLEAGTKVLISDSIHQKWILKRYGAAIDVDENNAMDDMIKKLSTYHGDATRANSQINIDHLTITEQTKRLIKFYKTLAHS